MAVAFSLRPIGASSAVALAAIDDAMRVHFGAEPDPVNWFRYWYDTIGFSLACGRSWDDIRAAWDACPFAEPGEDSYSELRPVIDWLEANYEPTNCGYSR